MYNKPNLGFLMTTEADAHQCPSGCNINIHIQPPDDEPHKP